MVVTTTARPAAVSLVDRLEAGGLPWRSYVSPWNPLTLKSSVVEKRVAQATDAVVERATTALGRYVSIQ